MTEEFYSIITNGWVLCLVLIFFSESNVMHLNYRASDDWNVSFS